MFACKRLHIVPEKGYNSKYEPHIPLRFLEA